MKTSALRVGIVGLGAAGAFAARALARRGVQVTGLEQFSIGHDRGASAGETRMFRVLYGEGTVYLDLVLRARALFMELEQECGRELLVKCGALAIGAPDTRWIQAMVACAERESIAHEVLSKSGMAKRFPQFSTMLDDEVGVFDSMGGIVRSNESILQAVRSAEANGAKILPWTRVDGFEETGSGVSLVTSRGSFDFDRVIVSTGSWAKELVPSANLTIRPVRHTLHYSVSGRHAPDAFPPSMVMRQNVMIYGTQPMPDSHLVKYFSDGLANYQGEEEPVIAALRRQDYTLPDAYLQKVAPEVADRLPGVNPAPVRGATLYEGYTPDVAPLIGSMAQLPANVISMIGLSGHGFKLSPAYGEIVADLATGVDNPYASHFDPTRFPRHAKVAHQTT